MLAGKPLIAYTIEEASRSRLLDRVIVSTDSQEIADIASSCGAEVPFIRPSSLAEDFSPDKDFLVHALNWLEEHEGLTFDIIVNLRPTAPFRTAENIDEAIQAFLSSGADFLKSVCKPKNHPYKMWKVTDKHSMEPFLQSSKWNNEGPDLPRQKTFDVYWQNAVIDILNRNSIFNNGNFDKLKFCPYIMSPEVSIDLDSLADFEYAEFLMKKRQSSKE